MHEDRTPSSFLGRWKRQRRHEPRVQEPADVGTAFGLEMSLGRTPGPDTAQPLTTEAAPNWMQRWRQAGRS